MSAEWTGEGRPTAEWVLGGCQCEPNYNHCATCDARRAVRESWVREVVFPVDDLTRLRDEVRADADRLQIALALAFDMGVKAARL